MWYYKPDQYGRDYEIRSLCKIVIGKLQKQLEGCSYRNDSLVGRMLRQGRKGEGRGVMFGEWRTNKRLVEDSFFFFLWGYRFSQREGEDFLLDS